MSEQLVEMDERMLCKKTIAYSLPNEPNDKRSI